MSDLLPSTVVTASAYTFTPTDNGTVVEGNSPSAQTFTIAAHAVQAFDAGAIFEVYQSGVGQITIAAAPGVNLRAPNGSRTAERYATVSLRQRAVDEWVLSGDTDGVGAGPAGPPGPAGADGPPGPAGGGTVSDVWVWLAPATSATVGATRVGVNNNSPALATEAWIHRESKNANIDYSTTISAMVAGDHLYLQAKSNADSFHRYVLTGAPTLQGGTTWKIPVVTDTGSPSGTEPANGVDVLVAFQFQPLQGPAGPTGATGATGPAGVGVPAGGTAGQSLTKIDATNYNTHWSTVAGSVATDAIWDTKGDLAVATAADTAVKLPAGSNNQVLTADSAQTTGLKWATPAAASSLGSIIALTRYDPSTYTAVLATSATAVDVDATNLAITFTVPSTGKVLIELSAGAIVGNDHHLNWCLREGSSLLTGTSVTTCYLSIGAPSTSITVSIATKHYLSGLTPGASKTYKWGHYRQAGGSVCGTVYGKSADTLDGFVATMLVYSVP